MLVGGADELMSVRRHVLAWQNNGDAIGRHLIRRKACEALDSKVLAIRLLAVMVHKTWCSCTEVLIRLRAFLGVSNYWACR